MDIEHLTEQERCNMLAEMADLYYNQGKTQSEIAKYYDTNRFRVAKLLQDARNEQIVEIRINPVRICAGRSWKRETTRPLFFCA